MPEIQERVTLDDVNDARDAARDAWRSVDDAESYYGAHYFRAHGGSIVQAADDADDAYRAIKAQYEAQTTKGDDYPER